MWKGSREVRWRYGWIEGSGRGEGGDRACALCAQVHRASQLVVTVCANIDSRYISTVWGHLGASMPQPSSHTSTHTVCPLKWHQYSGIITIEAELCAGGVWPKSSELMMRHLRSSGTPDNGIRNLWLQCWHIAIIVVCVFLFWCVCVCVVSE